MTSTGTYDRLRLPVWASDLEVLRKVRRKIKKAFRTKRAYRAQRRMLYRGVLTTHHKAQALCREFRL